MHNNQQYCSGQNGHAQLVETWPRFLGSFGPENPLPHSPLPQARTASPNIRLTGVWVRNSPKLNHTMTLFSNDSGYLYWELRA